MVPLASMMEARAEQPLPCSSTQRGCASIACVSASAHPAAAASDRWCSSASSQKDSMAAAPRSATALLPKNARIANATLAMAESSPS